MTQCTVGVCASRRAVCRCACVTSGVARGVTAVTGRAYRQTWSCRSQPDRLLRDGHALLAKTRRENFPEHREALRKFFSSRHFLFAVAFERAADVAPRRIARSNWHTPCSHPDFTR